MQEKETNRVEAFSDGVFAIAITLLILEIKVPSLNIHTSNSELFRALYALWTSYFAFFVSFIAILIMWVNHHGFFRFLRTIDSKFLFANGFLLMMVTFVPFPTAILAKYINTDAAISSAAFYCGTFVIISFAYNLLWFTSAYNRRLVKHDLPDEVIIKIRNAYWFGFAAYSTAFGLCFYNAIAGLTLCFSLWILWTVLDYATSNKK